MTRSEMVAAIDAEIERLQQVQGLLRNTKNLRPKYEHALSSRSAEQKQTGTRRKMSPEGRRRIIEAQKRRWAKQKQQNTAKAKKAQ